MGSDTTDIARRLRGGPALILDGPMGTALQARGLPAGAPPDGWCLDHGDEVAGVHRAYVRAGAEAIHTNTFGATPARLRTFGLEGQAKAIAGRAAGLAKGAGATYVLGAIGPVGRSGNVDDYERLGAWLVEAGVDALVLETIYIVDDGLSALAALRRLTKLPIVASFTFAKRDAGWITPGCKTDVATASRRALDAGADALGANCCEGAAGLDEVVDMLVRAASGNPVIVRPSAGLPRDGVWPESPEVHAAAATRFVALGAAAVGTCCGATPAHVAAVKTAVRAAVSED